MTDGTETLHQVEQTPTATPSAGTPPVERACGDAVSIDDMVDMLASGDGADHAKAPDPEPSTTDDDQGDAADGEAEGGCDPSIVPESADSYRPPVQLIVPGPSTRFMRISLPDQIASWFAADAHKNLAARGSKAEIWIRGGRQWLANVLGADAYSPVVDGRPSPDLIADRRAKFARMNADNDAKAMAARERESEATHKQAQKNWLARRLGGGGDAA